jgi:hypothetical protein
VGAHADEASFSPAETGHLAMRLVKMRQWLSELSP